MANDELQGIKDLIKEISTLAYSSNNRGEWYEAASLAQAVIHGTVGGSHPIMADLRSAIADSRSERAAAASRAVIKLYEKGALVSPRLVIAHEIEGDLLAIANLQLQAAEKSTTEVNRTLQLSIAAFLAGCALEDALRRLCISAGLSFDAHHSSISKLQAVLYRPSSEIEIINASENKQITAWGDTRNKADHGKFDEITSTEVAIMVIGVQGFIDRHLP